jgi:DNA-binding MarR family transcriptional regulator
MERALADLEVTPPQFSVLTMLAAYPDISNADLARLALLTPQTISVIIVNLERAGLVMRRPHAIHGRIQHLKLSDSGKALLAKCKVRTQAVERELAAGLKSSEELTIKRWLVRVAFGEATE